jgi:hypothetical protein
MAESEPPPAGPTDERSRERTVAEHLWRVAAADALPPGDVHATIELLLRFLDAGLRRWIGAEGYAALLSRAATDALRSAPALAAVSDVFRDQPAPPLSGRVEPSDVEAAVKSLIVAMARHLGAVIGDDLALRLIALSAPPSTRGPAGDATHPTVP